MGFTSVLLIFVLACIVGWYGVRSVPAATHMPLVAVISGLSSVIIVGALIVSAEAGEGLVKWLGLTGVTLASIAIFGGFTITERALRAYREENRK